MKASDGALKAIVAYEPGNVILPDDEKPWDVSYKNKQADERMIPQIVSRDDFKKFTKFLILIIYGDNIAKEHSEIFNVDLWRISSIRAQQFVEAVNRHGGDARLIHLPEIGIKGNTHASFADINNHEIADHLENFLKEKKLDGREYPRTGSDRKILGQYTIPLEGALR